jgi:multidrug resistance efflux pump
VLVSEGSLVQAGDVLLRLDPALLRAQRVQAEAQVQAAEANAAAAGYNLEAAQATQAAAQAALDLLQAGSTPEQLAAAGAQVSQADANRMAAEASLAALTAGSRPEQVAAARARLDQARQQFYTLVFPSDPDALDDTRTARQTAADQLMSARDRLQDLSAKSATPDYALAAASAALADAQRSDEAARTALEMLEKSSDPLYLAVNAARNSLEAASLRLEQARARETYLLGQDEAPQLSLDAARADVEDAQALVDDVQVAFDSLDSSPAGRLLRAAWDEVQSALLDLNGLGRGGSAPLETLLNQVEGSRATQNLASANLTAAEKGARQEQIDSAQAQLDTAAARTAAAQAQLEAAAAQSRAAQAAIDTLDVQLAKLDLAAPADGVVLTLLGQPGEFVAPGSLLLVLGETGEKTIIVYIPEDLYGRISLGQEAQVAVDSFPGEQFRARVMRIADQAEFTPRNVQTAQGRKNTVFAVKLGLDDPQSKLKPGMPADVVFDQE